MRPAPLLALFACACSHPGTDIGRVTVLERDGPAVESRSAVVVPPAPGGPVLDATMSLITPSVDAFPPAMPAGIPADRAEALIRRANRAPVPAPARVPGPPARPPVPAMGRFDPGRGVADEL